MRVTAISALTFVAVLYAGAVSGAPSLHLEAAAEYSAENKGLALIVMVDGETVLERYDNGGHVDKANHIHSATKSFWGPAIAAMIEDGLIASYDELVADTITEWRSDARKSRITIRHILNLTGGLRQSNPATDPLRDPNKGDKYRHALEIATMADPGARFSYGPNHFYVLGELMKRKLDGGSPLEYLERRLLDPVGARIGHWDHDPTGDPNIPNGAYLTAQDWARFGQLMLQGGVWDGRRIIDRALLAECFEPGRVNPGYGLTWWLNRPGGYGTHLQGKPQAPPGSPGGFIYPAGPPDIALAAGKGRNKLFLIPSLGMVVVRQASGEQMSGFEDATFLGLLLTGEPGDIAPPSSQRPSMGGSGRGAGSQGRRASSGSGGRSAQMLARLDADDDGAISRDEIPDRMSRLDKAFDRIDRDGDGRLSAGELDGIGGGQQGRAGNASRRSPAARSTPSGPPGPAEITERVTRVSPPGASYFDPEFLQSEAKMTYVGDRRTVWVADMDPDTGLFASGDGRDYFVDSDMAPLSTTFSGPEFGVSRQGWAIFYDKKVDGVIQIWRGAMDDGEMTGTPLTSGHRHQTARASEDPDADSIRVMFIRGSWRDGVATWIDEQRPGSEHEIERVETGVIALSWIRGTTSLVMTKRTGQDRGQIVILDTETGERTVITDDADDKTEVYGWRAPEYDGEVLVLGNLGDRALAVYKDNGGRFWDRIATLPIPAESNNKVIGSAEPFTAGGASYISLSIKSEKARIGKFADGEIWIFGIDGDPARRLTLRCDSGERPLPRFDPEVFVGTDEAFVYYNAQGASRKAEIRMCRTGIPVRRDD